MTTAGSLENQELMSQGKNLSVQRCAGPKSLPNRRKERANDREHGLSKLSREPFKFNLLNENRVFSRHTWTPKQTCAICRTSDGMTTPEHDCNRFQM
jgi:hypothetical protein